MPEKRETDIAKTAEAIARRLFRSGSGESAFRLALMAMDGRDLGGWALEPATREIERALTAAVGIVRTKSQETTTEVGQAWSAPDGRLLRVVCVEDRRVGVRNERTGRLSYMRHFCFDQTQKWHLTLVESVPAPRSEQET
jgi:hypothetical protein